MLDTKLDAPPFFTEMQWRTLGIFQLQSRFAWGFFSVTGVSLPHVGVKSTTMLSNICLLLFWWKKLGFFHPDGTRGHWVVKGAQTAGTYRNENGNGIESIVKLFVYGSV